MNQNAPPVAWPPAPCMAESPLVSETPSHFPHQLHERPQHASSGKVFLYLCLLRLTMGCVHTGGKEPLLVLIHPSSSRFPLRLPAPLRQLDGYAGTLLHILHITTQNTKLHQSQFICNISQQSHVAQVYRHFETNVGLIVPKKLFSITNT